MGGVASALQHATGGVVAELTVRPASIFLAEY